jgi:hypothetical protein
MSDLPSVPFAVPVPGLTLEQYLSYLSWRADIQFIAKLVHDWKGTTSGGEKAKFRAQMLEKLFSANQLAERFPTQPLPDNIPAWCGDEPFVRIPELLADLHVILV